jgi:hypothetical protein
MRADCRMPKPPISLTSPACREVTDYGYNAS